MQVKNNTQAYQGFTVRTNPGENVETVDAQGNKIVKPAMPILRTVRIPPEATVEIEDKVWEAAMATKSTRQKVTLEKEPVAIGSDQADAKATNFILNPVGDGVQRAYFPIREMVKEGILVIVEQPKLSLTLEDMRKAIETAQGFALPKEISEEKLIQHYHKICE